jgi:DNA-binding LytR/AlgR family response regulator
MKKAKLRILIADSQELFRNQLQEQLLTMQEILFTDYAKDHDETIYKIIEIVPDAIFVDSKLADICLPNCLEILKDNNLETSVVLTSEDRNDALKAIKHGIYDFLLKPFEIEKLQQIINKFQERKQNQLQSRLNKILEKSPGETRIRINSRNSYVLANPDQIVYCKSERQYTDVHLNDGSVELASITLLKAEELLSPYNFVRINRGYLINPKYLREIDRNKNVCTLVANGNDIDLEFSRKQIKSLIASNLF